MPLQLLGLLHPEGNARRTLVLGTARTGGEDIDGPVDLVVVAPDRRQGSSRTWVPDAARRAAAAVSGNGIVYVLGGPFARRRLLRRLRSEGLRSVAGLVHVPDVATSRRLVPVRRTQLTAAASDVAPAWLRVLLSVGVRMPGAERLLAWAAPSVGVVAQRPQAPPPFSWLAEAGRVPFGTITRGWQGSSATVLTVFPPASGRSPVLAKVVPSGGGAVMLDREAVNLDTVARSAAAAGAAVPALISLTELPAARALVQTALDGRVAAVALLAGAVEADPLLDRIGSWLDAWASATSAPAVLNPDRAATNWLEPAALLAPLLTHGAAYRRYLEERCRALEAVDIPIVATHQDLTMWNVLLDTGGGIGIVDWEAARPDGLPLVDLIYATVDAYVHARPSSDRPSAFRRLFGPAAATESLGPLVQRSARALGIGPEAAGLCLDACWLSHAANEHRASPPAGERPFLAILEQLSIWRTQS